MDRIQRIPYKAEIRFAADITARDALTGLIQGTFVYVFDSMRLFIWDETVFVDIVEKSMAAFPVYADDTAAGIGGLTSGRPYKTSTGEIRVKV